MKLALKLPLAVAALMLMSLVFAQFGILNVDRQLGTYVAMVQEVGSHERSVGEIGMAYRTQLHEWKNVLLRGKDAAVRDKHWARFGEAEKEVAGRVADLSASLPKGGARTALERFAEVHADTGKKYRAAYEQFVASGDAAKVDESLVGVTEPGIALLGEVAEQMMVLSANETEAAVTASTGATRLSMGMMLFAGLAGIAAGLWLGRSIARPLSEAAKAVDAVAGGDLTVTMHGARGKDEIAALMQALQRMQQALGKVVGEVRRSADGLATAAAEISHGNADLSARTEAAASAIEETSASMHELGAAVRATDEHASEANRLAQGASEVAARGGSVVGQVVETMKGITESSRRIADIIGVIDGIAFQTNILALNAAVEAARAGEQGRGFAVVASEVRTLAQRSAQAAREIKDLISTSVDRVEQGTAFVDQAGETMNEIVSSIGQVTTIMNDIGQATHLQSASVSQVGDAIAQMDHTTQQNAALVEQSAAAAEGLKAQAAQLVSAVSVFKTH